MKMTSSKIAELAGVHRSTVDRVIHDRPGVSEKTKRRVQRVIDEFGYRPNIINKARRRDIDEVRICCILLNVDARPILQRGFDKAIHDYSAFKCSLAVEVVEHFNTEQMVMAIRSAIEQQPDGIVLHPLDSSEVHLAMDEAQAAGIPIITINGDTAPSHRLAFVGEDMFLSGQMAGRLMAEFIGRRGQVAILTSNNEMFSISQREAGFRDVIGREFPNVKLLPSIETFESPKIIFNTVIDLLAERRDLNGIFMTCGGVEVMGRAVLDMERQKKLRIITYESYPKILDLIARDVITCTMANDLEFQGFFSVRSIISSRVLGQPLITGAHYSPIQIILKENMPAY